MNNKEEKERNKIKRISYAKRGYWEVIESSDKKINKSKSRMEMIEVEYYKLKPGYLLWVPKSPNRTFDYYLTHVANYTTILCSLATVILLFLQLGK